jgi:broad specificity phosphatase PhoE
VAASQTFTVLSSEALARRHGAARFGMVFASPLSRASEGARLIAGAQAQIVTIDEFVEVDFGIFEGLTSEEIRIRYPAEFARWNSDRLSPDYAYPGGESRAAFAARVGRGVDRMLEVWERAHEGNEGAADRSALLVAHRGVIRAVTQRLAGAEPSGIELGSIHILRHERGWRAELLDAGEHLAGLRAGD